VDASSYEELWQAALAIEWVTSGLMTFFFFVPGWRRGASLTSVTFASPGGSCSRCWRRSAA
jgi:hypothetical protein